MSEATEGKTEEVQEKDESQTEGQGKQQVNETEDKARKMGWVPKDEFRGDPEKWRPADEFVERGENMVPLLRSQVKRQDKEIAELKQTMQQFAEYHTKTEQRAYERALAELKAERAKAIAAGDGAAFARVDDEIEDLRKDMESKQPAKKPQADQIPEQEFNEWLSRNQWANDRALQVVGKGIGEALVAEGETARGVELLELVTKEVKKRYPEKFENPRRQAASFVEGAGAAPRKGGKTYADLPAEAKKACDDFTKQKLLTREQYVKSYFQDQE